MQESQDALEGSVNNITFYNNENGYCVLKLHPSQLVMGTPGGVVTVVGIMPEVQPGEYIKLEGTWQNNPKYGRQFKAEHLTRALPVSEAGMKRYLGSGLIKGVGPKTAEKIVDHFGIDTLSVLDGKDAARRLREVESVGRYRANSIAEAWVEQREIADVMMFLQEYRVGTALALKIYRFYKAQDLSPVQILQSDPYQLTRDILGVGFKTADRIAQNIGLDAHAPGRLQAALVHVLNEAAANGHVFVPAGALIEDAIELLELAPEHEAMVEPALDRLIRDGDMREDDLQNPFDPSMTLRAIYPPTAFHSERGVTQRVLELIHAPESALTAFRSMTDSTWAQFLRGIADIALTGQQEMAVRTALTNKLTILTGGPGTGKTTTLRTVIAALDAHKHRYMLASPTGRAAKRLSQATGRPARTIHRMLGFNFSDGFVHNMENTLNTDFVVVDESSMLDIHLFYALMRALPPNAHLLLVGDVDQLPSVGAGDVLRDLIASDVCPVTRLDAIFRQEGGSQIISNAHRINQGELPVLTNDGDDFFFFGKEDPHEAAELLVDIVKKRIPQKFGYDSFDDVQVLSPMYRTPVGVDALNASLQENLNPPGRPAERRIAGQLFRVGDKVLQTRNNYEKEVYNGDIGRIKSMDFNKQELHVVIEGETITYDWGEADQLTLAYACSVHRAQGSEYPVVVMPMLTQHYMMLQRNLLYTAITRARKLAVLVGTRKAVSIAVKNNQVAERWSGLEWRLQRGNQNR